MARWRRRALAHSSSSKLIENDSLSLVSLWGEGGWIIYGPTTDRIRLLLLLLVVVVVVVVVVVLRGEDKLIITSARVFICHAPPPNPFGTRNKSIVRQRISTLYWCRRRRRRRLDADQVWIELVATRVESGRVESSLLLAASPIDILLLLYIKSKVVLRPFFPPSTTRLWS